MSCLFIRIVSSSEWSRYWLLVPGDVVLLQANSDSVSVVPSLFLAFRHVEFLIAPIVIEDEALIICIDKCNTKRVTGQINRLCNLVPGSASF